MTIAWIYLDKRGAAIDALKDYAGMEYIIKNQPEELAEADDRLLTVRSSVPTGMPHTPNPHAGEARLAATLDEIDVLKERYRRALEYMEWFQPAWDALSDDERYVLTEFFLREDVNKTEAIANVCGQLFIERSQAYRKKDKALSHLTLLLYGK